MKPAIRAVRATFAVLRGMGWAPESVAAEIVEVVHNGGMTTKTAYELSLGERLLAPLCGLAIFRRLLRNPGR